MRERRFVERGRGRWERLELAVGDAERKRVLAVDELAAGYRSATTDLAIARSRGYDARLVDYLDRLVSRAHAIVYGGTSSRWSPRAGARFLRATFPREVRRSWKALALCVAVGAGAGLFSYGLTTLRPSNASAFVSPAMLPTVNRSLHDTNFGFNRAFAPAMSAMVITNNIKVSAVAVAGGVTAGILTISVIAYNGMMVGTLAALFARRGLGGDFWATIAPHGVIELTAIHIAGAAGLLLAAGILRPGRLRRGDAFARNARRAGTLMLGVAAMLVVAGTIEGFVSPQRLPGPVRVGVGVVTGLALLAYFAFAGTSGTASERSALLDRDVGVEDARA
jgi:uncharacterized membrane protein SpoIIM required for sporulation